MPDDSVWRQIKEFPNYWVSNHSEVINLTTGHVVTQTLNEEQGVVYVRIFKRRKAYRRAVEKLRREAFGETLAEKKIVTMLQIPTAGPWDTIFYMCGGCGEAVKLQEAAEHAKEKHGADGVDLIEVVGANPSFGIPPRGKLGDRRGSEDTDSNTTRGGQIGRSA